MFIRLEDSLVRGELDCRERGQVRGRLWLLGRTDPVELDLVGIPARELGGCSFRIRCEYPPSEQSPALATPQKGHLLSCTVSGRKKVPAGPERDIQMRLHKRIPHPWTFQNVVHLEWISAQGDRVVLEGTGLKVTILEPSCWTPTPEEEQKARIVAARMREQWQENESLDRLLLPEVPEEEGPFSKAEKEADEEHRKMERLNDRIQARLEKLDEYSEERYDQIYEEEREKIRIEFGEPEPEPLTYEQIEDHARWIEEMNRITEEALEEWEAGEYTEPERHPLVIQCDSFREKVTEDLQESEWMPEAPGEEHPLRELTWGLHMATAKLTGAMGMGVDATWPPDVNLAGPVLIRLKLVRGYLRDVLTALDAADEENLGVSAWRKAVRHEASGLLHETELLIAELRELLS